MPTETQSTAASQTDAVQVDTSRLVDAVDRYLDEYMNGLSLPPNLEEAVRYALLSPGKRARPIMAMLCCEAMGADSEAALPAAAAVEMIHAFSLVHDDLPALDNDDLRRGRPTTHVKFGEAMGLLAGDGLMSLAFQIVAERVADGRLAGDLSRELATGTTAMIAGQVLDTLGGFPDDAQDAVRMEMVHRNKTGALIRAACRMGAYCGAHAADLNDETASDRIAALTEYGEAMGLMFQVVDDILDVEQSTEHLGKRSGKDEDAGKLAAPAVLGIDASRQIVDELLERALNVLGPMGERSEPLRELARALASRTR